MAGWDDILNQIQTTPSQLDVVRQLYLNNLQQYTGRNVIAYYSGWLSKGNANNTDINDNDMPGFMNAVKGVDTSKGLDLILHTPGGSPTAAEAIVKYLRVKFNNDIRVIVPQLAMSAGTMIACSSKNIIMGKQSSLGPIDPQFNGIPAYNIKAEFEEARADLAVNPQNVSYWQLLLSKYPVSFLKMAIDSIELSSILLKDWLGTCMFNSSTDSELIDRIVTSLNENTNSKSHGRHLNIDFCQSIGLKIIPLESEQELQDKVLSVHHAFIHTLTNSLAVKIIENHIGKAFISQEFPK